MIERVKKYLEEVNSFSSTDALTIEEFRVSYSWFYFFININSKTIG